MRSTKSISTRCRAKDPANCAFHASDKVQRIILSEKVFLLWMDERKSVHHQGREIGSHELEYTTDKRLLARVDRIRLSKEKQAELAKRVEQKVAEAENEYYDLDGMNAQRKAAREAFFADMDRHAAARAQERLESEKQQKASKPASKKSTDDPDPTYGLADPSNRNGLWAGLWDSQGY